MGRLAIGYSAATWRIPHFSLPTVLRYRRRAFVVAAAHLARVSPQRLLEIADSGVVRIQTYLRWTGVQTRGNGGVQAAASPAAYLSGGPSKRPYAGGTHAAAILQRLRDRAHKESAGQSRLLARICSTEQAGRLRSNETGRTEEKTPKTWKPAIAPCPMGRQRALGVPVSQQRFVSRAGSSLNLAVILARFQCPSEMQEAPELVKAALDNPVWADLRPPLACRPSPTKHCAKQSILREVLH